MKNSLQITSDFKSALKSEHAKIWENNLLPFFNVAIDIVYGYFDSYLSVDT